MIKIIRNIILLTLAAVLFLSSFGCAYTILGCTALSCVPDEIKDKVEEVVKEEFTSNIPQVISSLNTPETTQSPSDKTGGNEAANTAFQSLDREIFTWYVTSDIITLDQYCYDPASFGIDEKSVPVTLGDFTEESMNQWIADCKRWLDRLQKLDYENLSEQYQFAYDNYVRYFTNEISYDGLFYYQEPLDEYVGLQVNLPLTFGLYEFREKQDVENYLVLLADVPRYFGQVLKQQQKRAEMGLFMTEPMLDSVLKDIKNIVDGRESNYLYNTFREELDSVGWLTDNEKAEYYDQNDQLVHDTFTDAYVMLGNGLEALRPYCRANTGAKQVSEDALKYFTLEMNVQSASNFTLQEASDFLEQISSELYQELTYAYRKASGKELEITTGTIEGDERYLKTIITDIVPPMPAVQVKYKNIPEELQEGFSPAAYLIPALDHYQENTILINPRVNTDLLTLAHEGYPGHMFQYTYQYNLGTVPLFQMAIEPVGYAEGWATSAEYSVAKRADMFGAYDCITSVLNDNLTSLIIAKCSILANGFGYSKDQIQAYLMEWGLENYADEIYQMSVDMPVYRFKYVMGFCYQYEITAKCKKERNIQDKDIYTEYLSWGPGYFDLLEDRMQSWAEGLS